MIVACARTPPIYWRQQGKNVTPDCFGDVLHLSRPPQPGYWYMTTRAGLRTDGIVSWLKPCRDHSQWCRSATFQSPLRGQYRIDRIMTDPAHRFPDYLLRARIVHEGFGIQEQHFASAFMHYAGKSTRCSTEPRSLSRIQVQYHPFYRHPTVEPITTTQVG